MKHLFSFAFLCCACGQPPTADNAPSPHDTFLNNTEKYSAGSKKLVFPDSVNQLGTTASALAKNNIRIAIGNSFCNGIKLSPNHVLTSQHCVTAAGLTLVGIAFPSTGEVDGELVGAVDKRIVSPGELAIGNGRSTSVFQAGIETTHSIGVASALGTLMVISTPDAMPFENFLVGRNVDLSPIAYISQIQQSVSTLSVGYSELLASRITNSTANFWVYTALEIGKNPKEPLPQCFFEEGSAVFHANAQKVPVLLGIIGQRVGRFSPGSCDTPNAVATTNAATVTWLTRFVAPTVYAWDSD